MSGLEPAAAMAALTATEAGGAGMASAAAAAAAEAALASGVAGSAIPGIAATAAGSAVPGMAAPAMQAAGTQGLAGAMGQQLAPVFTAGVNSGGTVIPGMNQGANLLTTPFARFIDAVGPKARMASNLYQVGSKAGNLLTGQQQQARPAMATPQAPPIPQMAGGQQRQPTPVELMAWNRIQARKRMAQQRGPA